MKKIIKDTFVLKVITMPRIAPGYGVCESYEGSDQKNKEARTAKLQQQYQKGI